MADSKEVVIRRAFVWRLVCEGKHHIEIRDLWNASADEHGYRQVSKRTIDRDSVEVKREGREELAANKGDAEGVVADSIQRYQLIFELALRDYRKKPKKVVPGAVSSASPASVGLLRVALDAQKRIIELMQGTGYLRHDLGVLRIDDEREFESMTSAQLAEFIGKQQSEVADVVDILTKHSGRVH